jgi:urea carboxylase
MLAKIIVAADNRPAAIEKLNAALAETSIYGIETNLDYLRVIAQSELLGERQVSTTALRTLEFVPDIIEVLSAGAQSSMQELPGRLGLWHVGVPPSGPMDERSFRHANRLVGNDETTAALELTVSGPTLKFFRDATVSLVGARMPMMLDGVAVEHAQAVSVPAGAVLSIGSISGPGQRAYLAVAGGLDGTCRVGITRNIRSRSVRWQCHRHVEDRPRPASGAQGAINADCTRFQGAGPDERLGNRRRLRPAWRT